LLLALELHGLAYTPDLVNLTNNAAK